MKRYKEKKKHPILPTVLTTLLILSISIGVVWAVSYVVTDKVENNFKPAQTSIAVKETFNGTTNWLRDNGYSPCGSCKPN